MHIVIIGYVWPEPDSSAAGQNMINIITAMLKAKWHVSFLCTAKPSGNEVDLNTMGVETFALELNSDSANKLLLELNPDIVIFDRFMVEEQFNSRVADSCPNALRVLNTEDLHALRDARHQYLKNQLKTSPIGDYQVVTDFSLLSYQSTMFYREVASIIRSDITLLVSDVERQLLIKQLSVPDTQLMVWPLVSQLITQNPTEWLSYSQRKHLVFIGNFRHEPNWDAVRWLRECIWPSVRNQHPNLEVHIYGAYPPEKVFQLNDPRLGFLVKGWAKSPQQVLHNALLCLAPLRFGAGVKGKILDAIQCGTPSITTSIGAESIGDKDNWPGIIADTAETFSQAIVSVLNNKEKWDAYQRRCYSLATEQNVDEHQQSLINRLTNAYEHREQLRKQHFLNGLLQHHSVASTRYMTQWIAAKNKLKPSES